MWACQAVETNHHKLFSTPDQLHTGLFGNLVLPKGFDLAIIEQAELAEGYSYFADVSTFPLKTGNFQEHNIVTSDGKIIQTLPVQPFVLSFSDRD